VTFGVVANITDSFNFSIDYWSIDVTEAIGTVGASTIVRQCAETGMDVYCGLIHRSPAGDLWTGDSYVENTLINLGEASWEGIDLTVEYTTEIGPGVLDVRLVGTKMLDKTTVPIPSIPDTREECLGIISEDCFPTPEWRHNLSASYMIGDFTGTVRWRHIGAISYKDGLDVLIGDEIGDQNYVDFVGAYVLNKNVSFMLGINNIADKEPPLMGGSVSINGNTVAGFYDTLGRLIFANVTFSL